MTNFKILKPDEEKQLTKEQLTKEQLIEYYSNLRQYYKSQKFDKVGNITRDIIHPLMLAGVVLSRIKDGKKLEVMNGQNLPKKGEKGVIFVANHSNCHDFPTASEAVKRRFIILADSTMQNDFVVDKLNKANGAIYVDRLDSASCAHAKDELIKYILQGYSVWVFTEGTWNLNENLLMLAMKWGIIDIAKITEAPIIPLGIDYTKEKCIANVGKRLYFDIDCDNKESIDLLTDSMATLRWDIMEKLPVLKRAELDPLYFEKYVQQCLDEYPRFNYEYEQSVIFKPKGIISPKEAFDYVAVREMNSDYSYDDYEGNEENKVNNYRRIKVIK